MYANLIVRVPHEKGSGQEVFHAWKVEVGPTGVLIHLDDPEDESSYPVPVGEKRIAGRKLSIEACF